MKKRLFFLLVLAALCVTLLSSTAYADGSQFRLQHSWPSTTVNPLTPPYETWYFMGDPQSIYVTTGDRYTYETTPIETAVAYILDKGNFDDKTIYVSNDTAFAKVSGSFYGFDVVKGGSFTASVTARQEGNQLVFQCSSTGGSGVSYRYHVYDKDKNGVLIQSGAPAGNSFRVLVSQDDTYEAFVTAVDADKNVSDCGYVSIEFSSFLFDEAGTITGYIGTPDESGQITIPEEIRGIPVTTIGARAFMGNKDIESVIIPESVTEIQIGAFANCSEMKKIQLPDSVTTCSATAFSNCTAKIFCKPTSDTAKTLANLQEHFYDKEDQDGVFELVYINRDDNDDDYETLALYKYRSEERIVNNIPPAVECIYDGAFADNEVLEEVKLPENVKEIATSAFSGCSGLKAVNIRSDLTEIGSYAFANCVSLEELILPDTLETIKANAFSNCPAKLLCDPAKNTAKLLSDLPHPFYDANNDKPCDFELLYIDMDGKDGKETLALCKYNGKEKNVTTLPNVGCINSDAFAGNTILEAVTIPSSVTVIKPGAFSGCSDLNTITISATGLTEIGANTFNGCTALKKIMLPDNIKTIDPYAFTGCNAKLFCVYSSTTAKKLSAIGHPFYNLSDFQTDPPRFALLYREDGRTLALHEYTGTETGAAAGIDVPPYVQAIDDGAFDAVKATLTKVGISAVEIIPTGLFDGFTSLTEITFGTGVRTVQPGAIQNCPELESVRGLQRDNAFNTVRSNFENCPKLVRELASSSMRLALDIPYAQKAKIENYPYAGSLNPNVAACENDVVTAKKTGETDVLAYFGDAGNYARIRVVVVSGLKGLTLPSALTTIEAEAFAGDSAAQYVALPDVTDIGNRAFADDTNLMLVNIPSTVTSFGENIFSGSDSVVAVIDNNDTAVSYCQDNNIPFQFAANSN